MFQDINSMSDEDKQHELYNLKKLLEIKENISVDTLLEEKIDPTPLKELGVSIAANGCVFKHEKSFLAELMEKLYTKRKEYKAFEEEALKKYEETNSPQWKEAAERFESFQWSLKITLNSAYGAIGNPYFRFYDVDLAEAITMSSQYTIKFISKEINRFLNSSFKTQDKDYIIANDTDSAYICLNYIVEKLLKNKPKEEIVNYLYNVCDKVIDPFLGQTFEKIVTNTNSYASKLSMNREVIADRGIWTAKKRYVLHVLVKNKIRYKYPDLKIVGLEAIKSTTPEICKKRIKNSIRLIMKGDEARLHKYIEMFKTKYFALKFEDIASPRKVSNIDKWIDPIITYKKGTPIHVRGSITYNNALKKAKLDKKYMPIEEGDKIKFCYMKMPNPVMENVLCIKNNLPPELDLERYIDYNTQFDKTFIEPLSQLLKHIGWYTEETLTLDQFITEETT